MSPCVTATYPSMIRVKCNPRMLEVSFYHVTEAWGQFTCLEWGVCPPLRHSL